MGYTHYFTQKRDFKDEEWEMVNRAFLKLTKNLMNVEFEKVFSADYCNMFSSTGEGGEKVLIAPEYACGWTDFNTHPESKMNGDAICFNGVGDLSHETFIMEKAPKEKGFAFCKTNGKPYDLMVASMLIVCAGCAEGVFEISSDGQAEDFKQATEFVSAVLKKPTKVIFSEEGNLYVSSPTPEEVQMLEETTMFNEAFDKERKKSNVKLRAV